MKKNLRVLMVEDSDEDAELVLRELRRSFEVEFERVQTAEDMTAALDKPWDIIISDYQMPRFSGPAAFNVLKSKGADVPFIIASGTIGEEVAVATMRLGVSDYLLKGKLARLVPAIERELREAESRRARRSLEDQLRQSQKMEAVGRLAGGVAHDFNNLLSVILSYSEMLIGDEGQSEEARADLVEIKAAAERARDLTMQLLAFSRRRVLQPSFVRLNDVVTHAERMLRRLLGEDVELSAQLESELGSTFIDRTQIEQVLVNLVVNARDAMPTGGKLTIETANVDLDDSYAAEHVEVQPGPYVMLAVTDSGTGMDEATRARIFEPFFTTKETGKGTGLGLSTVFGIVKQSGGNIWVYSELGRGTTMKVYFPRIAEKATDSPPPPPIKSLPPRGTETILLVEDEESVRNVAATILKRQGYAVLVAEGGDEALAICARHEAPIHLLLTDVIMPRIGGRELADRLAVLRPATKVLYMSGYTEHAIVHHGVLEPGVQFIEKPIVPDALARRVREVLDG
ncbi:MAG TPA: response regulator [Polyangiaceae bacterium]|jgi:signal transduction histidine kinase